MKIKAIIAFFLIFALQFAAYAEGKMDQWEYVKTVLDYIGNGSKVIDDNDSFAIGVRHGIEYQTKYFDEQKQDNLGIMLHKSSSDTYGYVIYTNQYHPNEYLLGQIDMGILHSALLVIIERLEINVFSFIMMIGNNTSEYAFVHGMNAELVEAANEIQSKIKFMATSEYAALTAGYYICLFE